MTVCGGSRVVDPMPGNSSPWRVLLAYFMSSVYAKSIIVLLPVIVVSLDSHTVVLSELNVFLKVW